MMKFFATSLVVFAFAASPAFATDGAWAYYDYNDGNGTCGTIACNEYGCGLVETHRCPSEISPNG